MKKIYLLPICLLAVSLSSCFGEILNARKSPNKTIVQYDNQRITAIDVSSAFELLISQGDRSSAVVDVPEILIPYLRFELSADGQLRVGLNNIGHKRLEYNAGQLKVHVTTPILQSINLSGACSASLNTPLSVESLRIDISGASTVATNMAIVAKTQINIEGSGASYIELGDVQTKQVDIDLSGASVVNIKGVAQNLKVEGSGASAIDLEKLVADIVSCDISGATSVKVYGSVQVSGEASGASSVDCFGGGRVDVKCTGASSVSQR